MFSYFLFLFIQLGSTKDSNPSESVFDWVEKNQQFKITESLDTLEYLENKSGNSLTLQYKIIEKKASIFLRELRNFKEAIRNLELLKKIAYQHPNKLYRIKYHNTAGEFYYYEGIDLKIAFREFNEALQLMKKYNETSIEDLVLCNYSIALITEQQFEKAALLLSKALHIVKPKKDYWLQSVITSNIGVNFIYLNQPDSAEFYFKESYRLALLTPSFEDDVERSMFLGFYYNQNQLPDKALSYFEQTLEKIEIHQGFMEKRQLFGGIAKSYLLLGDTKNAYEFKEKQLQYTDSAERDNLRREAINVQTGKKIEALELENEVAQLKNEQFKSNIIILILIISLLLIITLFLLIRHRQNKIISRVNKAKVEAEKTLILLEKESTEREIASKSMFLLEKDNLINRIIDNLQSAQNNSNGTDKTSLLPIISELKQSLNEKRWEEFEIYFNKVDPVFFKKLNERFPNLSNNERKLCGFLFLDMSTKDISGITGQTQHSINIARARLRKKLMIDNTDIELSGFLKQI